ncbi:S-protein homolog 5-like [Macadamia integrifolia]|uniref:S-protein homolog 5-like n=1 Tax=Macadamia integrifolia TaxID=60698 RepID=UPI001C4E54B3|nr:S-protein homolog 5-like [Macadamia integrifolia]
MSRFSNINKHMVTLLILMMWVGEFSSVITVDATRHVRIINELGEGYVLTIHCKSKDDDLGVHDLSYQKYFEWGFHDNLWGTTLYFCRIQWRNADVYFDIYDEKRDRFGCCEHWWAAKMDALYSVNPKTGAATKAWLRWHGN